MRRLRSLALRAARLALSGGLLGLGLLLLAPFASCAPSGPSPREYVAEARRASGEAEAAAARGDRDAQIAALTALAGEEPPPGVALDDARVIRQDAYERLARARHAAGDAEGARRAVEAGLALGERDDLFTANLLTTRGRLREAAGEDRDAAADYHRALTIHEALLEAALGER